GADHQLSARGPGRPRVAGRRRPQQERRDLLLRHGRGHHRRPWHARVPEGAHHPGAFRRRAGVKPEPPLPPGRVPCLRNCPRPAAAHDLARATASPGHPGTVTPPATATPLVLVALGTEHAFATSEVRTFGFTDVRPDARPLSPALSQPIRAKRSPHVKL